MRLEILLLLALLAPARAAAQPFSLLSPAPGGIVDPNSWAVTHTPWSGDFSLDSKSGNEFGLTIQTLIPGPTGAQVHYERAAILAEIATSDPDVGLDMTHDTVGIQSIARVNKDNTAGDAWGGAFTAGIVPGGDGSLFGLEIDVVNNGTDQPSPNTLTSKTGLDIADFGHPMTTAINLESSNAHTGIFAPAGAPLPPDAQLIDSGIKVRWSDGATTIGSAYGGYKENSINVAGGYYLNSIRSDMPVYNEDGTPWAPDGAFMVVNGSQLFLCSDKNCFTFCTK